MSLKLTFRQKLIRIICSAAACGLSISFIVGEAVDFEATHLRNWKEDPALFPLAYLPLRPMSAALAKFDSSTLEGEIIAVNSLRILGVPASAWEIANPSFLAQVPSSVSDHVSAVQASPLTVASQPATALSSIYSGHPSPSGKMAQAPAKPKAPLHREEPSSADVERVMNSIEVATAKLAKPPLSSPQMETIEAPLKVQPKAANKGPLRAAILAPWMLSGRVLSSTGTAQAGHYEIGIYPKIDPDGLPVGYPLVQQILPAGQTQFHLQVPGKIEHAYLYGEFVASKGGRRSWVAPPTNPWGPENKELAELYLRQEDTIAANSAAPELNKDVLRVHGTVGTMFTAANAPIPQEDVIIKVRGRKESVRTDKHGIFTLELPRLHGQLYLEVLKAGFQPTIVNLNPEDSRPLNVEIASRHAVSQIAQRLGLNQGSLKGVFLGKAANPDGSGLRGLTLQTSVKAEGPFYFDDEGVLDRDAKATSSDGRFLFLNVESGIGYVETSLNGEAIAPFQLSTVDGGELVQKTLTPVAGSLKGRLFNPVSGPSMSPLAGARVRVDGATDWVVSDSFGAFSIGPMKWMRGEKVPLEFSADHFNNHRYLVDADHQAAALNLFAFPTAYLSHLAKTMDIDIDTYSGLVIGKVTGPSMRIDALADHSSVNGAKDFYFDGKGRLKGSHEMTDPRFGTYIIFNVPKGRTMLQGNDSAGALRYSDAVFSSASSVNVIME